MKIRWAESSFSARKFAAFLLLIASPLLGQNAPKPGPLPTVQQVMEHYVEAMGGRDAIFQHKSMTVRGKTEVSGGGPVLDSISYYKDGKMLYDVTLADGRHYLEGYDGAVAWRIHPKNGPAVFEGNVVKSKARDADMYYPARILDYFSSMEVVEVTDFEGHTCYHLKGTNKWGIVNEQFFDVTSGLLVGYRFNSKWRGGPGEEHEVFSDYKKFGGWLMPTDDTHKSTDGTQTDRILSVTFDDVADSVFVLPAPIKEVLARKGQGSS